MSTVEWIGAGAAIVIAIVALWTAISKWLDKRDEKAKWIGEVNADRNSFNKFMEQVGRDLSQIRKDINQIYGQLTTPAVGSDSPIKLTGHGEKISDEWGAKEWVKQHAKALQNHALGKEEFEIYELCQDYIENQYRFTTEEKRKLHSLAYENGTTISQVYNVLIVELRDCLLKLI